AKSAVGPGDLICCAFISSYRTHPFPLPGGDRHARPRSIAPLLGRGWGWVSGVTTNLRIGRRARRGQIIENALRGFIVRRVVTNFAFHTFVGNRSPDTHLPDSDRREHFFLNELFVAGAGDRFDHTAEHAVTETRIGVARARIEIARSAQHIADSNSRSRRAPHAEPRRN